MPPIASKKTISAEAWEAKLAAVKVSKDDMNRLVMNFLVTEVSQGMDSGAGMRAADVLLPSKGLLQHMSTDICCRFTQHLLYRPLHRQICPCRGVMQVCC